MKLVDIKGFEDYQITDDGRVWSKKRNKWLKPIHYKNTGYFHVNLCKDGVHYTKRIHRLVAEAFIPNHDNKPCIDHINTVKTDNRVENLKWCTYKENTNNPITKAKMENVWKNMRGIKKISKSNKKRSEQFKIKNKERQINRQDLSKQVFQYTLDGELVGVYASTMEAERVNGFSHSGINKACKGVSKTYKGFKWSYNGL